MLFAAAVELALVVQDYFFFWGDLGGVVPSRPTNAESLEDFGRILVFHHSSSVFFVLQMVTDDGKLVNYVLWSNY